MWKFCEFLAVVLAKQTINKHKKTYMIAFVFTIFIFIYSEITIISKNFILFFNYVLNFNYIFLTKLNK